MNNLDKLFSGLTQPIHTRLAIQPRAYNSARPIQHALFMLFMALIDFKDGV